MEYTRLRSIIQEQGYTLKGISKRLNICYSTFLRKLSGKSQFTAKDVYILADVLRLSRDDVLLVFFPEEVRS